MYTIDFNNELRTPAHKIEDVRPFGRLPAERPTSASEAAQLKP
jgi:hypothetical protein